MHKPKTNELNELWVLAKTFPYFCPEINKKGEWLLALSYLPKTEADIIMTVAKNIFLADKPLFYHSLRVGLLAQRVGAKLCLNKHELLFVGGLLHDTGKLKIPRKILDKKGKLTQEEREIIDIHSFEGYKLLLKEGIEDETILSLVLHHHRRYDNTERDNYPWHLDLLIMVLNTCDAYDAMTSERPYRSPLTNEEAIKELENHSKTQFNPFSVEALTELVGSN